MEYTALVRLTFFFIFLLVISIIDMLEYRIPNSLCAMLACSLLAYDFIFQRTQIAPCLIAGTVALLFFLLIYTDPDGKIVLPITARYNQQDDPWGSKNIPYDGLMSLFGCSTTFVAEVLTSSGTPTTPEDIRSNPNNYDPQYGLQWGNPIAGKGLSFIGRYKSALTADKYDALNNDMSKN